MVESFLPNTLAPLQTALAAESHVEGGQFLLKKQTLNIEKSLIH
jgi:hypothetical protein